MRVGVSTMKAKRNGEMVSMELAEHGQVCG